MPRSYSMISHLFSYYQIICRISCRLTWLCDVQFKVLWVWYSRSICLDVGYVFFARNGFSKFISFLFFSSFLSSIVWFPSLQKFYIVLFSSNVWKYQFQMVIYLIGIFSLLPEQPISKLANIIMTISIFSIIWDLLIFNQVN